MEYRVRGVLNQVLEMDLDPGESVWVQKQGLVSYSPGIRWTPRVPGRVGGMVMRFLSGESFFLLDLLAETGGRVNVASLEPSVIYAWDLAEGPVTTLRGNFLAAQGDVRIEVGVARKPLAAFLGGAGFLLQTVYGTGTVFVAVKGDVTEYRLEEEAAIRVATGNLAAFSREIDFDVRLTGGCRKIVFGGEGAVMTRLGGPGLALTQSAKRSEKPILKLLQILEAFA